MAETGTVGQSISDQSKPIIEADVASYNTQLILEEIEQWLNWQCCMLSGVESSAVLLNLGDKQDLFVPWPSSDIGTLQLKATARKAIERDSLVAQKARAEQDPTSQVLEYLALPVTIKEQFQGAAVIALKLRTDEQLLAVRQLFQWGIAWLKVGLQRSLDEGPQRNASALLAVDKLLQPIPLAVSGYHLCQHLAQQFDCEQVILGLCQGLRVKVSSLSDQLQFDPKADSILQIELAMEECVDQLQLISCSTQSRNKAGEYLTHAHSSLLKLASGSSICSIPLTQGEKVIGCVTLVSNKAEGLTANEQQMLNDISRYTGPALALKITTEHSTIQRSTNALKQGSRKLFGGGHLKLKAIALAILITTSLLTLVPGDYTVTARSQIEGAVQQLISAPFTGYIETVKVRPGDYVEKDQVLASLENHDLMLEKEQWSSNRNQLSKEYYQALATGVRSDVGIMKERLSQAQAKLDLINAKLFRAQIKAPFAGIVINGDLSQSLGLPVEQGKKLFELSPLDEFRIIIQVDELDIEKIQPGQIATLRLTGFPDKEIAARITRIVPIASERPEGAFFRVEASVDHTNITVQPGMKGIARIKVSKEPLYKVWGQTLFDRIQLWLWSVGL